MDRSITSPEAERAMPYDGMPSEQGITGVGIHADGPFRPAGEVALAATRDDARARRHDIEQVFVETYSHEFLTAIPDHVARDMDAPDEVGMSDAKEKVAQLTHWLQSTSEFGLSSVMTNANVASSLVDSANVRVVGMGKQPRNNQDDCFLNYLDYLRSSSADFVTIVTGAGYVAKRHPLTWHAVHGPKLVIGSAPNYCPMVAQHTETVDLLKEMYVANLINRDEFHDIMLQPLVDTGVISGPRRVVTDFLGIMCRLINMYPSSNALHGATANYAVQSCILKSPIAVGAPFTGSRNDVEFGSYVWIERQ